MRYVIVENSTVTNAIEAEQEFADSIGAVQSDTAQTGWTWDGETFAPPTPDLEALRAAKLSALAERRWQAETGGVMVNGAPIRTDATSQAKIAGADLLFERDPTLTEVDWEAQPGVWVTVDRPTMTAIGIAVGRHVQACFSNAKGLSQAILAAEDAAALDAIDIEDGWPG